jgi:hypothetical protein
MKELHVVAAVRAIDVVVFHDPSAVRALVAAARDPVEASRRHRDHQQADNCM